VADHQKFREHFGCDRILHADDITASTRDVEIKLTGEKAIALTPDLLIIPVPGHTKGHTVLLHRQFLFTGDHLAWSYRLNQLYAFRRHCWYSWSELIESMGKLTDYTFEWVLPGHGRRYRADAETMQLELQKCLEWMKTV
jgi:glyoxylase-like metal-dependent hydrolase (beta-lactamase superfamily II)